MKTIKGPGIFLAQFLGDTPPFNTLDEICKWSAGLGFKGVQIPSWATSYFDLQKAAESKTYADEIKGVVNSHGLQITELSTHLQGLTMTCLMLLRRPRYIKIQRRARSGPYSN
jgi:sugar phosphate isomerase/epimerase